MDHKISFCFHVHRIEIVFALFAFLIHGGLCLNSNSTNCEPQNCGNGQKIEHPFWIEGIQEPSCGSSGFGVSCKDRNPVLRISGDDYVIINIFYANESLLLSQYQSYDGSNGCPVPKKNFSVEGASPFSYGPETMDLFFFYNCSLPYDKETYVVDCASNSSGHSFAVFHPEILEHGNYSISSCQAMINAPVTADAMETLLNENFSQVLRRGFVLQWGTGGNCRNCRGSRGKGPNVPLKVVIGIAASFGTAVLAAVIGALLFFVYKRRLKRRTNSSSTLLSGDIYSSYSSSALDPEKCISNFGVHIFDYYELEEATNNFNPERELGDGGFGTVYKGKLKDGRDVAVKRLYENNFKRVDHFKNEVIILTRLRHKNLVTLYGCTSRHSRELLLVYEYVANGTVADHLHGALAKPGSLPWSTRMKIAVETASALCYLHASDVIHRDVKTNNILLDSNFCVKVADFGLSRLFPLHMTHISTAPQGTPGYVDPEYHQCYQLTDRSDVFSFGVVLIELITSMPAVDITRHRHEINLSNLAINKIQSKTLHEIVDPNLGFERDETVRLMVLDVAELAFQSLQQSRDMRPSMQEVLDALKHIQAKDGSSRNVSELDDQADEAKLLEARNVIFSPNSVIEGWTSSSTTPNISN